MGDLAGWPYWKVVSITGQAGAGVEYQVELDIGDSAGGDFHLEGHCTNFPQDIRITDDDGTTLLDHWVEDLTADPIVVHVEVKDDLGSNQDIRIYYGKSGETTASNGANTFIRYHGTASSNFLDTQDYNITSGFIYEGRAKTTDAGYIQCGMQYVNYQNQVVILIRGTGYNLAKITSWRDNVWSEHQTNIDYADNSYHDIRITFDGTSMYGYIDDTIISASAITTNIPTNHLQGLQFGINNDTGDQLWSFIRKYNSPEPAFSSAGAEQSPTGVSPTGVFYGPLIGPFGGPV